MTLTKGERIIMDLLWSSGPMTAKEISAALWTSAKWAKTTTYTMVGRCVDKGLIRREEPDYLCIPCLTREEVIRAETERLIDNEYGGSVDLLMTALIGQGKLNAKQLKSLYETLAQMEDDA